MNKWNGKGTPSVGDEVTLSGNTKYRYMFIGLNSLGSAVCESLQEKNLGEIKCFKVSDLKGEIERELLIEQAFNCISDEHTVDCDNYSIDSQIKGAVGDLIEAGYRGVDPEQYKRLFGFLCNRLVDVYGENPNVDYILKSRELLGKL